MYAEIVKTWDLPPKVVKGGKNLAEHNVEKRKQALSNFLKLTVSFFGAWIPASNQHLVHRSHTPAPPARGSRQHGRPPPEPL